MLTTIIQSSMDIIVANRTAEIQRLTNIDNWRYVSGQDNPADSLSRGVMPNLLHNLEIWWSGLP